MDHRWRWFRRSRYTHRRDWCCKGRNRCSCFSHAPRLAVHRRTGSGWCCCRYGRCLPVVVRDGRHGLHALFFSSLSRGSTLSASMVDVALDHVLTHGRPTLDAWHMSSGHQSPRTTPRSPYIHLYGQPIQHNHGQPIHRRPSLPPLDIA